MRGVFYSPMANADTRTPSGVSRMGGLFVGALRAAGVDLDVPSLVRTYEGTGDALRQAALRDASKTSASELISRIERGALARPDFWFSYHVYYKSPDWIGPLVADALRIPYVVAEGSHAPKRANGAWKLGHEGTAQALVRSELLLAMTQFDRVSLDQIAPGRVCDFKPFIDAGAFEPAAHSYRRDLPHVLAVGMMRNERKRQSFRLLAEALQMLGDIPLRLTVAGDGPFRGEVEGFFTTRYAAHDLGFAGAVDVAAMPGLMASADIFAWPGLGEAYGLVFLEAQAAGLPVVACRDRGVPDVTQEDVTALLSPSGDVAAYASHLRLLLTQRLLRRSMGESARRFVLQERSVPAAAARLMTLLREILP